MWNRKLQSLLHYHRKPLHLVPYRCTVYLKTAFKAYLNMILNWNAYACGSGKGMLGILRSTKVSMFCVCTVL